MVVCYLLRYKFWKLFTTVCQRALHKRKLYVIYFDTNFESYSQRRTAASRHASGCMLSTSIQILKAIHNANWTAAKSCSVVCYLLRYKFWKLFTTQLLQRVGDCQLYVIYFDTNFESYSQQSWFVFPSGYCCMLSTSIQILKAIHNMNLSDDYTNGVVCYLLRYKFWKLFTTAGLLIGISLSLYVIYFDTNFESYSQRVMLLQYILRGCMLSTSIQILKAIHN